MMHDALAVACVASTVIATISVLLKRPDYATMFMAWAILFRVSMK